MGFDSSGLTSITFDGREFLSSGDLRVNAVTVDDGRGGTVAADLSGWRSVDVAAQRVCNGYPWGDVCATFGGHDNQIDMTLTVTNRGARPINGVFLEPLALRLPLKAVEYDGVTPLMMFDPGEPGIVSLSSALATVVLAREDHLRPIVAGFPWALDRPASTRYPLRVNTGRDSAYPTSYPRVDRDIPPGGSDQFSFSLRFASGAVDASTLVADVYRGFAAAFAPTLQWADRRPIGQLVLATSAAGFPRNPRGWLLDSSLDVTTDEGRASLRRRVLAWADESIGILRQMNAQGMITWDIEGEEYPHSTTYICDPRLLARLAPEMEPIADEYFARFRDAGLRIGVCVRPQTVVVNGPSVVQVESADPAQTLIDKIAYAKARWGASLFYIDSNGDPGLPMDVSVIQRVAAAHPDVLLIPEHENTAYYAYAAPYRELKTGNTSTPASVRRIYPSAFGVTYVADGDFARHFQTLVSEVRQGDALMTRAWFGDTANAEVLRVYANAPPRPGPPVVAVTAPAAGSRVTGTVAATAAATGGQGIAGLQFSVNGAALGPSLTVAPYSVTLDTRSVANGPATITATAADPGGFTSSATVAIVVDNPRSDVTAPVVALVSPAAGSTASGVITVVANATDDTAVTHLQFRVDGVDLGPRLTSPPFRMDWNTAGTADGTHVLTVEAGDAAGNVGRTTAAVTIVNVIADRQPPVVTVVAPTSGSVVAGTVLLRVSAADGGGAVSVRVAVQGASLGVLNAAPFVFSWDSTRVSDGSYAIEVVARDAAGNEATTGLTVVVRNAKPDTRAPSVTFRTPRSGAFVGGLTTLSTDATDNVGVASVQYSLDGRPLGVATAAPYAQSWNTTTVANGLHILRARAQDAAGNNTTAAILVVVYNPVRR